MGWLNARKKYKQREANNLCFVFAQENPFSYFIFLHLNWNNEIGEDDFFMTAISPHGFLI